MYLKDNVSKKQRQLKNSNRFMETLIKAKNINIF